MKRARSIVLWGASGALCLFLSACATTVDVPRAEALPTAALDEHRAWWQAYTAGDHPLLERHTAPDAAVTFSSGVTLSHDALLEASSKNAGSTDFKMIWSDEAVRVSREGLAVVTATSTEGAGLSLQSFRMMTVIEHSGRDDWRVLLAQSTRVSSFAPPVPESVSGHLKDYTGDYRTPKGRLLRMEIRDAVLWMVEPDGKSIELTPTGPGLFEPTGRSPINGILRFVFARDATGKVVSFSRLTEGRVDVFPRAI